MIRIVLGAALAAAVIGSAQAETKADLVKRGDYLVNTIMTCGNCHSPKGPQGDIKGREFSGGLSWDEPPFKVTAPNITQDKDTGIGKWTDAQIRHLLRTGVRPNGTPIAAVMPVGFYKIITERDMDAIVVYLRTLEPVRNKVPDPIYRFPAKSQTPPGAEMAYAEAMLNDKVKKGFYLATIGHCFECHTPMTAKGHNWADYGRGGMEFPGPWGTSVSRNITASKDKGIGGWTEAEIVKAVTTGVAKDGTHLKPPMGFAYYAHMTGDDLDALVAYLRTVPAKE
jgi:mono/diheme cytochrome c family protein